MIHVTIQTPRGPVSGKISEDAYRQMWAETIPEAHRPKRDFTNSLTPTQQIILQMLKKGPMTAMEIKDTLNIHLNSAASHCAHLLKKGHVNVSTTGGSRVTRTYFLDAPND